MRTIKLRSLSLVNFKGIRSLEIAFPGQVTEINGKNGSGKTTRSCGCCSVRTVQVAQIVISTLKRWILILASPSYTWSTLLPVYLKWTVRQRSCNAAIQRSG